MNDKLIWEYVCKELTFKASGPVRWWCRGMIVYTPSATAGSVLESFPSSVCQDSKVSITSDCLNWENGQYVSWKSGIDLGAPDATMVPPVP